MIDVWVTCDRAVVTFEPRTARARGYFARRRFPSVLARGTAAEPIAEMTAVGLNVCSEESQRLELPKSAGPKERHLRLVAPEHSVERMIREFRERPATAAPPRQQELFR